MYTVTDRNPRNVRQKKIIVVPPPRIKRAEDGIWAPEPLKRDVANKQVGRLEYMHKAEIY